MSVSVDNGVLAKRPATLAVTPGQVNACAGQGGNSVTGGTVDARHIRNMDPALEA
jgi:hypothetical protein